MVGGAPSLLTRAVGGAAALAFLVAYYLVQDSLPDLSLWWDIAFIAVVLIPLVCHVKHVATSRLMLPIQVNLCESNLACSLPNSGSMKSPRAGRPIALPSRGATL